MRRHCARNVVRPERSKGANSRRSRPLSRPPSAHSHGPTGVPSGGWNFGLPRGLFAVGSTRRGARGCHVKDQDLQRCCSDRDSGGRRLRGTTPRSRRRRSPACRSRCAARRRRSPAYRRWRSSTPDGRRRPSLCWRRPSLCWRRPTLCWRRSALCRRCAPCRRWPARGRCSPLWRRWWPALQRQTGDLALCITPERCRPERVCRPWRPVRPRSGHERKSKPWSRRTSRQGFLERQPNR